ncbi:unnamed protein product [Dovyalis caffra]|uniref:Uncharacterized protein n=1 Tax=Dovyalis caffra TaxID=77055 RepID=A0AAV1RW73_9ROSI|nr:unnamed protein product [Dovyalis caffra]
MKLPGLQTAATLVACPPGRPRNCLHLLYWSINSTLALPLTLVEQFWSWPHLGLTSSVDFSQSGTGSGYTVLEKFGNPLMWQEDGFPKNEVGQEEIDIIAGSK